MPIRIHPNPLRPDNLPVAGLFLLLIMAIVSCNQTPFLAKKVFDQNCWAIGDTIRFEVDHTGAETTVKLGVEVHFIPEYSYRNLYLSLLCKTPGGEIQTFVLNDTLMDADGNWQGEYAKWTFSQGVSVPVSAPGTYRFSLVQYMRDENLCDIKQAGVFVRQ